ncbi:MAG TPA: hypothetical protein VIV11_26085 [Kofleriaceae bacterium]
MTRVLLCLAVLLALPRESDAGNSGESARIRAHLNAALHHLHGRDLVTLSPPQRAARARSIATLERYIADGLFPRRAGDAFGPLRPRFIDDRGVHCAVGHLVAASGAPELARAINAEYEYAFVRDMRSPALVAWAHDHGFTVDELAIIQPSYSAPPTGEGMKIQIEHAKDDWILACTGEDPPPARIQLRLTGDSDGNVVAKAKTDGGFERCFADHVSGLERGRGAYSPSPTRFTRGLTIELPSPQRLLERWIAERTGYGPDCTPRPGAVPKRATIDVVTASDGVEVQVKTQPHNADVAACIKDYLAPKLIRFRRHIKFHQEIALTTRVNSKSVEATLRAWAPGYATDCYTAEAPAKIKVRATAKRDDKQYAITVEGANETFATCLTTKLQPTLRTKLSVPREREGKVDYYFRIDSDVDATHTFPLETPSARETRLDKARKDMARRRRELEEELKRRQYEM